MAALQKGQACTGRAGGDAKPQAARAANSLWTDRFLPVGFMGLRPGPRGVAAPRPFILPIPHASGHTAYRAPPRVRATSVR